MDGSYRSVRDGGIAAAIGVALALSQESGAFRTFTTEQPLEAPWVSASRIRMNLRRTGWQIREGWGELAGWDRIPGNWRPR